LCNVKVLKLPGQIKNTDMSSGVAVVIDVLRATSSIATALTSGSRGVIPAANRDEALRLQGRYPGSLLCGEENGKIIPGFHLGNSPLEYTPEIVKGKTVILTTSNGTKAVLGARDKGAVTVLTCAFLNLDAVKNAVLRELSLKDRDVFIICSGSHGEFSFEDFVCAGGLVDRLLAGNLSPDDSAKEAREAYLRYQGDVLQALLDSPHGRYLEVIGYGADLPYCAKVSVLQTVPYLAEHIIQDYADRH
jgi:2-phosphosulfolactate phosphatase